MQRVEKILGQLTTASTSASFHKPVKVVVTGAAGNIAYSVLFGIGRGKLLGENTLIDLRLLDIPPMEEKVKGVIMELDDCAFPILNSIVGTSDYETAFKDAEVCLLIGARPRGKGMVRADLLKANAKIFEGQGKAIEKWADRNVKVCVVGNPANTNALITMTNAPSIPRENFTALTRLDQNRAISQIARKANVAARQVKNVIIWGNHSKTQYPDVHHAYIDDFPSATLSTGIRAALPEDWLNGDFIKTVQQRGKAIIDARGMSSAASAANATLDHVRDWMLGTPKGRWVNMAVPSDGSYGIAEGIVYSYPVTCSNGTYTIVQGLPINDFSRQKMKITEEELRDERKQAGL